jgi:hypothetical protein
MNLFLFNMPLTMDETDINIFISGIHGSQSQWPRGLRHELFLLARTLGSWVRIPLKAWMSVRFSVIVLCV